MYETDEKMEGDVELIDFLRVIWKWKYLLLTGTFVCGCAALIISLNMPEIYQASMELRPAIFGVDALGENIYVDSTRRIKSLIESESLQAQLLDCIGRPSETEISTSLQLYVFASKKANTLKVLYESPDKTQGLQILNCLKALLEKYPTERVLYFKDKYKSEIDKLKFKLARYEARKRNLERKMLEHQEQIELTSSAVEMAKKRAASIQNHSKKMEKTKAKLDELGMLLVRLNNEIKNVEMNMNGLKTAAEIDKLKFKLAKYEARKRNLERKMLEHQEQIELTSSGAETAKKRAARIQNHSKKMEKTKAKLDELGTLLVLLNNEIKNVEMKMNGLKTVEISKQPSSNKGPTKPRTRLNVFLGAVAGLCSMIFLTFFAEYLSAHKGG